MRALCQVFDRRIKSKYFVGDLTLDLLSILPWVSDVDAALGLTVAHKDFIESINLKKLGAVIRDIQVLIFSSVLFCCRSTL